MKECFFCGHPLAEGERIYRSSTCSRCGKDLKICRNCRFYSAGAHWDCAESIQDPVHDKERANFCEFFQFREGPGQARPPRAGGEPDGKKKAQDALSKLFGEGS
jgi:hypothetical protein